jgi:Domain of unknown function (DUF1841)
MFEPSRNQSRQFWIDALASVGRPMSSPMELLARDIINAHPEYHDQVQAPDAMQREYGVEDGVVNPFMHMHMHLAVREQVSIDQPIGIRQLYTDLARRLDDAWEADHVIADALAEQIWQMQRNRLPFDSERYLNDIRRAIADR